MTDIATTASPARSIVFIDSRVQDAATLLQGLEPGTEVVFLQAEQDGLEQMAAALQGRTGVDAIHVLSHGQSGQLQLGSLALDQAALTARADTLAQIGRALSASGDILLYGCDVASGEAGAPFISQWAKLTQADVAASTNRTGASHLGGDWVLEAILGQVEDHPGLKQQVLATYAHVLTTPADTNFNLLPAPDEFTSPITINGITYSLVSPGGGSGKSSITAVDTAFSITPVKSGDLTNYPTGFDLGLVFNMDSSTIVASGPVDARITSTDGSEFRMVSMEVDTGAGLSTSPNLTFTGYRNGAAVASDTVNTGVSDAVGSMTYAKNGVMAGFGGTLTFGSDWYYIDEIRITGTDTVVAIDDLDFEPGIPSDATPPTVTSVNSSTLDGTYKVGDVISIQVNFSENVVVADGEPQLTLETGGTDRAIYYASGTGSSTLTFTYQVQPGDTTADLDYTTINALALNGSTLRDAAGNNAIRTLPSPSAANSLGANKAIVIDGVAPGVTSINPVGSATTNATSVDYTVTFSETVTGVTVDDFALTNTGTASGTVAAVSGSGSTYTVTVNGISGDGTLRLDLKNAGTGITDVAGNAITGGFSGQSYTIDNTAPAAPIWPDLDSASDTGVSSSDNITRDTTPTFKGTAEAGSRVTLYDSYGMTELGTAVATGGNWTITSTTLAEGTHTITARATDTAGNVSAASAGLPVTIDTTAPTLGITSNVSTLKIGETATITFAFSEDPGASFSWDGSTGDVVVSGGTLSAISGTGLIRTATFTPTANTNGGTASITVASGAYIDTAGNSGGAGVTPALTFDTLAPAAPSAPDLASASDTGVSNTDDITSNTTPTFTGTAEAGSTVTLYADGVSALGTATADGSGNWSFISSTLPSGTHTLSAKATDSAGNVSSASAGLTVTVDANPPSKPAAPVLATASDVGQSNSDGITNLTSLTLQGAAGSVEANATVHARSSLAGGLTNTVANADGSWSLNVTGLAQGTHQLQINATDAAGNTSTYSDASTVVIDTTAPTLAITSNVSALKTGETATITFTFSEDPGSTFTWDGTAGDVVVTGGTLSAISGTGATRTATFTPDANTNGSTASITVTAASYTDMAGNAGGAGTTPALSFDTLGPSTTASGFAFSADNGASAIDLVTNQAAQTISGTLSAALVAGESVEVSLDNGSTWAMAAATVGSSTWSLAGQTLAGSDTLQARVRDAAGNTGASTSKAYVLDVTAPTFHPTTGSAPADDASAVPVSGSLVLSFSEALASLDSTKVYLKDVNTDTLVAATISLNGSGKLVIQPTAALQNSTAYYVTWDASALRDAAGNAAAAVADETTYNFTTQAAPPSPPEQPSTPTVPAPVPVPVDGALVTTQTGADGTITTTIAPVTSGRVDDPSTPNNTLADVPLFQSGGNPVLLASLPVGFGLSASTPGLSTAGNSLTDLVRQIQKHTAAGSQDQSQLTSGGASFLGGLPSTTPLLVQTIVPTYQGSAMPGQALGISGQPAVTGQPLTALVINASGLPSGTSLQLNNVEFAAIIGSVSVSGGAGSQHVWGDGSIQTIFLGADDDVLHGGGGNDTVGSLGGNDQVFGDAGDDIVFGGTGHDTLSGGTGNDRLDGGLGWDTALQIGSVADYTLRTEGQFLVMTHKTTGEVDRLKSIETVQFDSGAKLYIADSNAEAALAHIVTTWLGRDLTPAEGAWAQQHSGLSDLQVAQVLLNVSYAPELQGHTAEELVAGWQGNPQIVRMDVASEHLQGTAELDQMHIGLSLAELSLERTGSDRWEGTSRIDGNMAEFLGIERLHLKDVSVALDTHGTAGQLAALLSVTLGSSALDNKGLVGEGLAALDAGMSVQAVGNIALSLAQAQQGHPFTAQETVQWLWTQATGSAGTEQQLLPLVDGLERGQLSAGALAEAAARYALEHPSVQLLGVLEQGLLYTPV